MNSLQPNEGQTVYQSWSRLLVDLLAWPLKVFETQQRAGLKIFEAALKLPESREADQRVPSAAPEDEFHRLETLAFERVQKGLALPREIYAVPYRDRVDWSRFPEWARPTDPEVFQNCGHEG